MKKFNVLIIALLMLFLFTACSGTEEIITETTTTVPTTASTTLAEITNAFNSTSSAETTEAKTQATTVAEATTATTTSATTTEATTAYTTTETTTAKASTTKPTTLKVTTTKPTTTEKETEKVTATKPAATKPTTTKPTTTKAPTTKPTTTKPSTTKPTTTAPTSQATTQAKMYCTVRIECNTIYDNISKLKSGKKAFLPASGIILDSVQVELTGGESAFEVIKKACEENVCTDNCKYCKSNGVQIEYTYTPAFNNYYIEGIHQIYEKDCGTQSGWMYSVNGVFPDVGTSSYTVSPGDVIVFAFTCNMGEDIGNSY